MVAFQTLHPSLIKLILTNVYCQRCWLMRCNVSAHPAGAKLGLHLAAAQQKMAQSFFFFFLVVFPCFSQLNGASNEIGKLREDEISTS